MSGLNCDPCTGQLVVAGITMHGPAWCMTDLTPLWGEANVRGSDRVMPNASGVRPHRRRITVTEHSLALLICGEVEQDGSLYPDPWVGLELNLKYLRDNVVDPLVTAAGTRAATLTMPSGATRTADIHVLDVRLGDPLGGSNAASGLPTAAFFATLEISIPQGRFT